MAKVTGIKISDLAKELSVPTKDILARLKSEGMGEKAKTHNSSISHGLAETVKEWFRDGGGVATAVEPAPEDESAHAKAKRVPPRRKKVEEGTLTEEAVPESIEAPAEPEEVPTAPPVIEIAPPPQPVAPAPPVAPPAPPEPAPAVAATAPAPTAPAVPPAPPQPRGDLNRAPRPTIRLGDRSGQPRPPVPMAPKLVTPAAATIQGPRIVRVEEPDVVPAPRVRRPAAEPQQGAAAQARPQAGRGVRVAPTAAGEDAESTEDDKKKKGAKPGGSRSTRRTDGRRGEALEKLKEWTDKDLLEREERLKAAERYHHGLTDHLKKTSARGTHALAKSAAERGEPVEIKEPITIKALAAALGVKSSEIQGKLLKQGVMATVNQALEISIAEAIALEYGLELKIAREATLEEQLLTQFEERKADPDNLKTRPPVVTILGHVDHGKTSLLDKIRNANVAAGEAGGITQHTAAWMVQLGEKRVTFIDTPGHQAFTAMRARGANMTDVVVLVVSAAEGVQPQTIESINHARAAGVPLVIAMNKIDRADANPDMILGQLAKENLNPVEWGGDTEVIRTSAQTGQGIPELIEILDYQSQLLDLKADPTAPARGTVIESRVDEGLGPIATVLVQDGTLKVGDIVLAGAGYGRIRSLLNDRHEPVPDAGPAVPVIISGLGVLPSAGDKFFVIADIDRARAIAEERQSQSRQQQLAGQSRVTRENLLDTMLAGESQTINLIIKADVQGSVETLVNSVTGQNTDEVKVRVIHSGVGAISESDVELAMATKTKPTDNRVAIIGFHVSTDDTARALAEQNHVDVKLYRVIYEIFDDLKKALSGMLAPEEREKFHGRAEIRQVYKFSKVGSIAGCMVTEGHIQRGSKIRLVRNGTIIGQDMTIETLRRVKEDVREVKQGFECGIKLANFDDIKIGDILEAYVRETIQRTL